jgi:PAS domain S-box-containing protein
MGKSLTQGKGNNKEMDWSRQSCRTIFEMVKDGIFITTVDGRIVDVNPSCLELFGYRDKEEALTLDLARDIYVNPEDRTRLLELVEKEGFVKDYEIEVKRRDGTKIVISLSDQVIRDEKGKTICYVGMIRDITKRREYERRLEEYAEKLEKEVQERTGELRESEEKYHSLFEGSKDALYITTEEGKFIDLNQATVELFGYEDKEELMTIKSTAQLYCNPKDREKMQEIMSERGYVKDMEQELRRKDGTKIHALVTGTIMRDERGNVIGYEGMIKDVTEHKRTDEQLRESEERYRRLVEDINDGYFIVQDGRFVYVNQAFANLSGYTKEEILGREFSELLPQEYVEGLSRSDGSEAGDWEHGGHLEFEISGESGEDLVLEIRSRIIEFNERPAIAGICKDITERKKAEMALKEKVEELERWYHLTVDREIKMTELKNRIQELESELKEVREDPNGK